MMMYKSIAISFRIQLGFHAANNEGAGGTNVMEPRRITVGDKEYDGISGEIIRRHILEHFVELCQRNNVPLHQRCKGLVPDRGLTELIHLIQGRNWQHTRRSERGESKVAGIDPEHYPEATQEMLKNCAVCDVAGFLYPLGEATAKIKVAMGKDVGNFGGSLKRDSCFEVGWLITEHPTIVNYTQHSAYDPSPEFHNLFVQNMRVGIYGGVLRVDLDRIGFNDWWWLGQNLEQYAIKSGERAMRAGLLLEAIRMWLLSPSFAKQAGWLQHSDGTFEGVIVLSKDGPAPVYSPIKFSLENNDPNQPVITRNPDYVRILEDLANKCGETIRIEKFSNPAEFKEKMTRVIDEIRSQQVTSSAGTEGQTPADQLQSEQQ